MGDLPPKIEKFRQASLISSVHQVGAGVTYPSTKTYKNFTNAEGYAKPS